jgi:hypothetical protein
LQTKEIRGFENEIGGCKKWARKRKNITTIVKITKSFWSLNRDKSTNSRLNRGRHSGIPYSGISIYGRPGTWWRSLMKTKKRKKKRILKTILFLRIPIIILLPSLANGVPANLLL